MYNPILGLQYTYNFGENKMTDLKKQYIELLKHLDFLVDYEEINSMSLATIKSLYDELFDNYIASW